jgi:hypothetical protein
MSLKSAVETRFDPTTTARNSKMQNSDVQNSEAQNRKMQNSKTQRALAGILQHSRRAPQGRSQRQHGRPSSDGRPEFSVPIASAISS